ncbi:WXG100 family type VII secretion target [Streptosporangium sp. CA-135522]|uniref:WXG100 family type VII secretion target n=1 Tax=Streptosporangium sp. CA-135522 TaxID=3240072 RepID=UPI003D93285C
MGSESKVLVIRSYAAVPQAGGVTQTKDQIQSLLRNTSPVTIEDAGFAYGNAAGTVDVVCGALQRVAGELAKVWGGEAAVEVQKALQMLHATGTELVSKMNLMSTTLRLYGGTYLPQAIEKINKLESQDKTPHPSPGAVPTPATTGATPTPKSTSSATPTASASPSAADAEAIAAEAANQAARKVLQELNERIVELYNDQVPPHVSYELPTVSLPESASAYKTTQYPGGESPYKDGSLFKGNGSTGTETTGSSSQTSGTGGTGSGGSTGGGSDTGGSGSGGPGSGSPDSGGPGSGGPGSPGSDPNGPGSHGTDPGGSGSGGSGSGSDGTGSHGPGDGAPGTDGGNGQGQSPADGASGSGHGKGSDGTAPAVIGGSENAPNHDPRGTETASSTQQPVTNVLSPNGVVRPDTFAPPNTVVNPTTSFGPNGTVSPVLGGPSAGMNSPGVNGTTSAALARGAAGNGMGAPFLPMGGGPAGEASGEEHSPEVYLPEKSHWESEHDATSPRIG